MNLSGFKEALSQLGNEQGAGSKEQRSRKKIITLAALAVTAAALTAGLAVPAVSRESKKPQPGRSDYVLSNAGTYTERPSDNDPPADDPNAEAGASAVPAAQQTEVPATEAPPTEVPVTPAPVIESVIIPETVPVTKTAFFDAPAWFPSAKLGVTRLMYADLSARVDKLSVNGLGADMISTEVLGAHENCPGVYYNPKTGVITCLYHEFLKASGAELGPEEWLEFQRDNILSDLVAVRIYETKGVTTTGLWVYDLQNKTARRIGLPEGCSRYADVNVYPNYLWNGKMVLSVNSNDGGLHAVMIYDTESEAFRTVATGDGWVSGKYLAENILELDRAGAASFINIDNGKEFKVAGEYNYIAGGKIFSVKNWGWASHKDVVVKVYDAETGNELENQTVLVQTVLDDGTVAFITKNTTTGEENVVLKNYSDGCYTWSKDYKYFYAYSFQERSLICYSAVRGTWFSVTVEGPSVEPVEREGKQYRTFARFSIAVSEFGDVVLYYAREYDEIPEIPEYSNEQVSSEYWDEYRAIKFMNFEKSTNFSFSTEDIKLAMGPGAGLACRDMTAFRDLLIKCLEGRGEKRGYRITNEEFANFKISLSCGTLRAGFWYDLSGSEPVYYMWLDYNRTIDIGGTADAVYEIPAELYGYVDFQILSFLTSGGAW